MKLCRTILVLCAIQSLSACATIKTKPVGTITVEDAIRLYMTGPTVAQWLTETKATPILLSNNTWKIILKDGWVFYKEYKDKKGVLYIERIQPESDDPLVTARIEELALEATKKIESHQ